MLKKKLNVWHDPSKANEQDKMITRFHAEESASEHQNLELEYKTIIQTTLDGFWITDMQGRFLDVNNAYCELIGYSRDELLKMDITDVEVFEKAEETALHIARIQDFGGDRFETRHRCKDGRVLDVEVSVNHVVAGNGKLVVFVRDITNRKKMEQELKESEEKFAKVFRSSPQIIAVTTLEAGRFIEVNSSFTRITGYTVEEAIGKTAAELGLWVKPKDRSRLLKELKTNNRIVNQESDFRTKSGEIRTWLFSAELIDMGKKPHIIYVTTDITERKHEEEKLRLSEEFNFSLLENSPNPISVINPDTSIRYVNLSFEKLTGFNSAEVIGLIAPYPWWHEEFREKYVSLLMEDLKGGSSVKEKQLQKKNGDSLWVEFNIATIKHNGEINYLVVNWVDITERKQAALKLQESEAKFRNFAEQSSNMIFINQNGRIVYANKKCEDVTKYTREELYSPNFNFVSLIAPKYRNIIEENFKKHINDMEIPPLEYSIITKGGKEIECILNTKIIPYEGNTAILGTVTDISERKRTEEVLRVGQEKYRAIFEQAGDSILLLDTETQSIVDFNDQAHEAMGYTREEFARLTVNDLITSEWTEKHPKIPLITRKTTIDTEEMKLLTKTGERRDVVIRRKYIRDNSGKELILVVGHDITERKKMEQQLVMQDRLASIGHLSSGMAHELNNPLTSVISLSSLLLQKDFPDDVKEDLEIIKDQSQRAAKIVKNLTTFANKKSQGTLPVDINECIQQILELRTYEQKVNNIQVNLHLDPGLPQILCNSFKLQQVFFDIISNAEFFMLEAHGKGILTIKTEKIGNYIRASFVDDGPGISKENMRHLFTPFFTTKAVGKGTGLGLSICHGIIDEHNGRIWAESEAGKGATFVIELPA